MSALISCAARNSYTNTDIHAIYHYCITRFSHNPRIIHIMTQTKTAQTREKRLWLDALRETLPLLLWKTLSLLPFVCLEDHMPNNHTPT